MYVCWIGCNTPLQLGGWNKSDLRSTDHMILALVHGTLVHCVSFTGLSFTVVHVILALVHGTLVHCASFTGLPFTVVHVILALVHGAVFVVHESLVLVHSSLVHRRSLVILVHGSSFTLVHVVHSRSQSSFTVVHSFTLVHGSLFTPGALGWRSLGLLNIKNRGGGWERGFSCTPSLFQGTVATQR